MLKRIFTLSFILLIFSSVAQAAVNKVAIVDMQKVFNKSPQIQALRKEEGIKQKEFAQFIKKAGEDIKKQTDPAKKKALAEKYDKELRAKQEANAKSFKTRSESIDKNINATIAQQAKAMGYDLVLVKGVALYGGDDITDAILKVLK